jgi:hypothetical protein
VNGAAWREQGRKRKREGAIAASKIGPSRRPEHLDAAAAEHVNRVTPTHQRLPVSFRPAGRACPSRDTKTDIVIGISSDSAP